MKPVTPRSAASLIEMICVVALLGLLIGLLLPAVQKVRAAAFRTVSINNLRQITSSVHQLENAKGYVNGVNWDLYTQLVRYLVSDAAFEKVTTSSVGGNIQVPAYYNPADPVTSASPEDRPNFSQVINPNRCNYHANLLVLNGKRVDLFRVMQDGSSTTMLFGERYSWCSGVVFRWDAIYNMGLQVRRPAFADRMPSPFPQLQVPLDVVPITTGIPPMSRPSSPGVTFQVRPKLDECNPLILQTSHTSGMLAGFGDGSVRTLNSNIQESIYWGLITPSGGEIVILD